MALPGTNSNNCAENLSIAADIFAEYGGFIYNVIYSKTRNKAQTDDLYQDFFLSLVSKPPPVDIKNIKSYLYKAITNDIVDANRQVQRYQALMNKYADNLNLSINKPDSTDASTDEGSIKKVFSLIRGHLSPVEAKAITLRYNDNRSNEEIAKEIGAKKESVSRYICVGLKKIRQILAAEEND